MWLWSAGIHSTRNGVRIPTQNRYCKREARLKRGVGLI